MSNRDLGDVFVELIQLLPKKLQTISAVIIAAALITFFICLGSLYFTGNLW